MSATLLKLLHLSDPTLPIGGYIHSGGLETYVQKNLIKDKITLQNFIENTLRYNVKYNDAAFVSLSYSTGNAQNIEEIARLSRECSALKSPMEIREASKKLGLRLIKIFQRRLTSSFLTRLEAAIQKKQVDTHYCLIFGIYAYTLGIPLSDALSAFYYNTVITMITNGVKLIPLGQLQGQDILFDLQTLLHTLAQETITVDRDLVGLCNIGLDIRCMQHERLYSRLYMS